MEDYLDIKENIRKKVSKEQQQPSTEWAEHFHDWLNNIWMGKKIWTSETTVWVYTSTSQHILSTCSILKQICVELYNFQFLDEGPNVAHFSFESVQILLGHPVEPVPLLYPLFPTFKATELVQFLFFIPQLCPHVEHLMNSIFSHHLYLVHWKWCRKAQLH